MSKLISVRQMYEEYLKEDLEVPMTYEEYLHDKIEWFLEQNYGIYIKEDIKEKIEKKYPVLNDEAVEELWLNIMDVHITEKNGKYVLKENWYIFSKGTDLDEIYQWFDEHHSKGLKGIREKLRRKREKQEKKTRNGK